MGNKTMLVTDYIKSLLHIGNEIEVILTVEELIEVIMYCKYNDDTYVEIMSYLKDIQIEYLKKQNEHRE